MNCCDGADLPPHTIDRLADATRRAELHALRTNPTSRILFWIGLLIAAEILALIALITASWRWTAILAPLTIPAAINLTVTATTTFRARTTYPKAWKIAWHDGPDGRAVAKITHNPTANTFTVEGVAAWPTATGLGTRVMHQIAHEADTQNIPLTLHASSRRVTHFYERLGWHLDSPHRTWRGGYPMSRPPHTPYTDPTEHTQSVSAGQPTNRTPQTPHPGPHR